MSKAASESNNIVDAILQISKKSNKKPQDVTWNEFQSSVSLNNTDKKLISDLGGFNVIRDAYFKPTVKVEKLMLKAQAKVARADAKSEADERLLLNKIEDMVDKFKPVMPPNKLPERKKFLERHQHLLISDTHFGSDSDPKKGIRKYCAEEEARSMACIIAEACEYKVQYRKETKLFVNLNGDIIQGKIHDKQMYDDVSQQICRAIHVLEQALTVLALRFPEVVVNCAVGNHDRIPDRHPDRPLQDKNDSFAWIIYFSLERIMSKFKNVRFNLPLTPYVTYDSFGAHYYGTHGDTHIKLPYPSSMINVKAIENDINKLNSRINSPRYDVVFAGHVHTGMLLHLNNGVVLITNPSLIPTDEYGLSMNIDPDAPTGQWIWESVEGHPVGDSRFLRVTEADRQNPTFDKLIVPYKR